MVDVSLVVMVTASKQVNEFSHIKFIALGQFASLQGSLGECPFLLLQLQNMVNLWLTSRVGRLAIRIRSSTVSGTTSL